jgi:hypothetical protein
MTLHLPPLPKQENRMQPEDRIKRHQETIERLKEDAEWLRETGFWTGTATNEELIGSIEQTTAVYIGLLQELTKPPG